jgi:transglutaminase/protease-like cytokinesis protein 3
MAVDKKALQLPDSLSRNTKDIASYINANFTTDKNKVRAIFIWVASNIQYDIANMFAINFYESREDKIAKPLKTRKGICENYAVLFNDICLKSGIKSYVIEGYTRQNGFTDYIPHAWCAARIDTTWFMFDPAWGSGYVNNGKFFKIINNDYFKVDPIKLIKSHMPFDYLWQFLNYPVTSQEFYDGKTQANKAKPFYNFPDSIKVCESQSRIEQLIASAARIEKNGVKNSMIFDRLNHIRLDIEYEKTLDSNKKINAENERQTKTFDLYNSAIVDYNDGINGFNKFIEYRNKQFIPIKPDAEIQNMLDTPDNKFKEARKKLNEIVNPDANITNLISQLTISMNEVEKQVQEQQDWLKLYFSKGKMMRKSMFSKYTWFGVPLN